MAESYIDEAINKIELILALNQSKAFADIMNINKGEVFILKILVEEDGYVNPSDLSKILQSSRARISCILNTLESKKYVIREIDEENRRNIKVKITDAGKEYYDNRLKEIGKNMEDLFNYLGEKDTKEFVRLIEKIAKKDQ